VSGRVVEVVALLRYGQPADTGERVDRPTPTATSSLSRRITKSNVLSCSIITH
jgi:hypothetical protein